MNRGTTEVTTGFEDIAMAPAAPSALDTARERLLEAQRWASAARELESHAAQELAFEEVRAGVASPMVAEAAAGAHESAGAAAARAAMARAADASAGGIIALMPGAEVPLGTPGEIARSSDGTRYWIPRGSTAAAEAAASSYSSAPVAPPLPGMIPALGEIATSSDGTRYWVPRGSSVESTEQRLTSMREGLGEWEEGGLSADIRASLRRMTQAHIRSAMAEIGVQVGDSRPDEGGGGGGGGGGAIAASDAEDDDDTRPFNTDDDYEEEYLDEGELSEELDEDEGEEDDDVHSYLLFSSEDWRWPSWLPRLHLELIQRRPTPNAGANENGGGNGSNDGGNDGGGGGEAAQSAGVLTTQEELAHLREVFPQVTEGELRRVLLASSSLEAAIETLLEGFEG